MKLPPYAQTLGIVLVPGELGGAPLLAMDFSTDVMGRPGFLHGGAISGLLEMAAIVALRRALAGDDGGEAARIKPINVTVDFMRGGRDKRTLARGIVTRLGSRVANVEAIAWQDDPARPIASARMNYLIVREAGRDGGVEGSVLSVSG